MWRWIRRSAWTVALASLAAACGQGRAPESAAPGEGAAAPQASEGRAAADAIYFGVAAPFTGDVAQFGVSIRRGAEMMVDKVNAAGGIEGRRIQLVFENDAGNPQEAAIVARKLASDDRISAVIGHFNSSCSLAGKPIYKNAGVVQFSPASTNPTVTKDSEWTFRDIYDDTFQGKQLAHYVHDKLGLQRIAVFYDNDDYGIGLKNAFIAEAQNVGIEIVGQESFERDTVDFTPQLAKIGSANPDAIVIAGLYTQGAQIAAQARRAGITVPLMGCDGLHSIDLIRIGGEATEGMLITVPFLFELGGPETKGFVEEYRARYKEDPDSWSALTYDAAGILVTAVQQAGANRRGIRDAIAAMDSPETGYHGVTGVTYFDEHGDTRKPVHIATVKDGEFAPAEIQLGD